MKHERERAQEYKQQSAERHRARGLDGLERRPIACEQSRHNADDRRKCQRTDHESQQREHKGGQRAPPERPQQLHAAQQSGVGACLLYTSRCV